MGKSKEKPMALTNVATHSPAGLGSCLQWGTWAPLLLVLPSFLFLVYMDSAALVK